MTTSAQRASTHIPAADRWPAHTDGQPRHEVGWGLFPEREACPARGWCPDECPALRGASGCAHAPSAPAEDADASTARTDALPGTRTARFG